MARKPITRAHPYTPQSGALAGQTFHSERQYRNALARLKGYSSWHAEQRAAKKVTTKSYGKLRASEKQARGRALEALSKMRKGSSLSKAAAEAHTTPNTVAKYAGAQLRREGGRMVASKGDRLFRVMRVITTEGVQEVALGGSRQASLVAAHANAVKHFLATGDDEPLHRFADVKVGGMELETDPAKLEESGRRGELEYEDIYESGR